MSRSVRVFLCALVALACVAAFAAVVPQPGRFEALVVQDPSSRLGIVAEAPDSLPGFDAGRAGWNAFRAGHGADWNVWLDRRSGAPTLVQGPGIRWFASGESIAADVLEGKARQFLTAQGKLFGVNVSELVFNTRASGYTDADHWVAVFDRSIAGVPVEGESFALYVIRGNLVAFGANLWGPTPGSTTPAYGADTAYSILRAYMGLTPQDSVEIVEYGTKVYVPATPAGRASARYEGVVGGGVDHLLAWRFAVRVDGEPGTWVGKVDALSGNVIAFYDDNRYSRVAGGVYPVSNDQNCAQLGCEIAGLPMPYVDVYVSKNNKSATGDMALFTCSKGPKNSTAYLTGPYVRIQDRCGVASDSGNCSGDLDFGAGAGTDCTPPTGQTIGDTHAGRTGYYHLNRIKEKARYWLPSNTWVNGQLTDNANLSSTCNAYWNGSVNFYRSGGGCRNTGEIAGVVTHEYGHGLDQNDGGGYDNPSEGYADVVAILQDRASCVGRGFFQNSRCSGYGDSCLSCTGIRDMDFAKRVSNTPATPANFTAPRCGGGGGPCGREVHCESYVPSEAIYDLAARDLPATGRDAYSSWQLAEKLFYKSRQGSGGNAFNCSLPASDGCSASSWFNKLRAADDDDGNLSNGTPHAAAIYAAFARHNIACGTETDPSNLSHASCTDPAAPTGVSATPRSGQITLSWPAVPGAASYLILRNEVGCDYASNVIATVAAPATSYDDLDLPAGLNVYYRVQAQASSPSCESAVSACAQSAAQ